MDSKKRSVGVFIVIGIALLLLVVLGTKLIKSREVAVSNGQPPVSQPTQQTPSPQPQEQQTDPSSQSNQSTSSVSPPNSASPSPSPSSITVPSTGVPSPSQVPATGPSYVDFIITGALMMMAAYFIAVIRRSRNVLKRMVLGY